MVLVINSISICIYGFLFNCMVGCQVSVSMTTLTYMYNRHRRVGALWLSLTRPWPPGFAVIKRFSCSTKLSTSFQLPIKAKMLENNIFFAVKLLVGVLILLKNVKMPTIVGILTFRAG